MKKILVVILILNVCLIATTFSNNLENNTIKEQAIKPNSETTDSTLSTQETETQIIHYEPQWTNYPPKRQISSNVGKILADIISHAVRSEGYVNGDPGTQAHETTHGICKRNENRYGFYCLENRMCYVNDFDITLASIAKKVPVSLRGKLYSLYFWQQQAYFNSDPIYIFDEWVAYTNGSACVIELTQANRYREQRWDSILFMREFDVYALVLAYATKPTDEQFKNFLGWQLERTSRLYVEARKYRNLTNSSQDEWMNRLRTSPDAEGLRQFTREYLGVEWTKRVLGF